MTTEFKVVRTHDKDEQDAENTISEPLLASFPANMPSAKALSKMQFNVFQQQSKKAPKRIVKAEYKGIKYEAKSYQGHAAGKDQASDYYLTLFDPDKNVAYALKVSSALQFS